MRKKFFSIPIIILMFLGVFSNTTYGDIYMKQKHHTDAMQAMGLTQPAQDMIVESWITPSKIAIMNTKQKIILDIAKKTITVADHSSKTVVDMPLDFSKAMAENFENISREKRAELQNFMDKMMQVNFKVVETAERKKIGKWNCRKYIQTMEMGISTFSSEIWATQDIEIDSELYSKYSAGILAQMPGVSQNMGAILEEIKKIKGVQVYAKQATNMMGQSFSSTVELLNFKEGNAPVDVFDLPREYKKIDPFDKQSSVSKVYSDPIVDTSSNLLSWAR